MKLTRLFFLAFLSGTGILKAQTDFRPGYIIENSGDTLYGEIDYRGDYLMSNICRFQNDENTIKVYSPTDIAGYRFIDSKYFISKEISGGFVFMEYLIKGIVNIYYYRGIDGDHYYLDREGERLIEIPYEEGIKSYNNRQVFYESKNHIGILRYFMQDAPEFQSRINSLGKPEHKNLVKLAEDYHNAVCDGEKCIIYEKPLPVLKMNLEILNGITRFGQFEDIRDKYYFQTGIIANFWLPRTNEKIYFRTGFLWNIIEDSTGHYSDYSKFSTHIGYMMPNTFRVRPSFSAAMFSPSYSAGVAVKLTRRLNIGIQSWLNFYPSEIFVLFPGEFINYSLLGNLYFEL